MSLPLDRLIGSLSRTGMTRYFVRLFADYPDLLMKDLTVEAVRPNRTMKIAGRWVANFGSDSFLGLDQDRRVQKAAQAGREGLGNAQRHLAGVFQGARARTGRTANCRLDGNRGVVDLSLGVAGEYGRTAGVGDAQRRDCGRSIRTQFDRRRIEDRQGPRRAHGEVRAQQPGRFGARAGRNAAVSACGDRDRWRLQHERSAAAAGRFSAHCLRNNAILYVDDAHGTGVLGKHGRGTVRDALGNYDNTLVVGSLSKAFSCLGGFIACSQPAHEVFKLRSNPIIFGGPVPPPYLEAICTVVDILNSSDYGQLRRQLDANVRQLIDGAQQFDLVMIGGLVPIVSVLVGPEETTMQAGRFLFDQGYYVQSVVFPAVPHGGGVLRMQVNANHEPEAIDGLLAALAELQREFPLPRSSDQSFEMPLMPAEIEVESIVA